MLNDEWMKLYRGTSDVIGMESSHVNVVMFMVMIRGEKVHTSPLILFLMLLIWL